MRFRTFHTLHTFAMNTDQQQVAPQNVRCLRTLYDGLARDYGEALSHLLRTLVDVSVTSIDPMTYGRFTHGLETPTCFYVLVAEPLSERLMLDVEPSILHPMIDRMLGGSVEGEPPPNRPLTEIELSLAARMVRLFLQKCRSAWSKALDLNLEIVQVEHDPRPARILPDDERVMVVDFELAIGAVRGSMRFCLPCRFVENLCDRLLPENAASLHVPSSHLSSAIAVTLAETSISAEALADLRPGDIIATETVVDSPVSVSIDGAAQFLGKPGTYQGRKAIRLTEPILHDTRDDNVPKSDGS